MVMADARTTTQKNSGKRIYGDLLNPKMDGISSGDDLHGGLGCASSGEENKSAQPNTSQKSPKPWRTWKLYDVFLVDFSMW